MAGLLATKSGIVLLHLLEDVTVADGSAKHDDLAALERRLQAHIRHGGGDHEIAGEQTAGFEVAGSSQQNGVAVDRVAAWSGEQASIGFAVESDPKIRFAAGGFRRY